MERSGGSETFFGLFAVPEGAGKKIKKVLAERKKIPTFALPKGTDAGGHPEQQNKQ